MGDLDNKNEIDITEEEQYTKEKVLRSIQSESMPMELSILELPLFQFTYCSKGMMESFKLEAPIKEEEKLAEEAMWEFKTKQEKDEMFELMGYEYKQKPDGSWVKQMYVETAHITVDEEYGGRKVLTSKGFGRLPRAFEFDVFFALFRLFVKKNGPFHLYKDTGKYEIKQRRLYFTFYELASFMKLKPSGRLYKELRSAIRLLKYTQYTSVGLIMDKAKGDYIFDNERPISLIEDYEFNSIMKSKSVANTNQTSFLEGNEPKKHSYNGNHQNMVRFSDLILENVENEYFKYLSQDIYFTLPSGLPRKIYGYLEKNRYDKNKQELSYIKRKYTTLKTKIPIDYDYLSRGKKKIENALKYMIDIAFIKDYIFCDEVEIDGKKEDAIIICFKKSAAETIKEIENVAAKKKALKEKERQNQEESKDDTNESNGDILRLPEQELRKELLIRGVSEDRLPTLLAYDKWTIIKMIMLVDRSLAKGISVSSPGGFLYTAIVHNEKYTVPEDILLFVEEAKAKEDTDSYSYFNEVKKAYEVYKQEEFERICNSDPVVYQLLYDNILDSLNEAYTKFKSGLLNLSPTHRELYNEFAEKGDQSTLFKQEFLKSFELNNIIDFETFKIKYKEMKSKEAGS